jgi:hypothetical protein
MTDADRAVNYGALRYPEPSETGIELSRAVCLQLCEVLPAGLVALDIWKGFGFE